MDDADRVVVELRRLTFEERVTAVGLNEPETERLRDGRRRNLSGGHQLHQLEARASGHLVAKGERVVPRVGRASARSPTGR